MKLLTLKVILLYTLSLLVISGCRQEAPEPEKKLNEKFKFNETDYQNTLKNRFTDESFAVYLKDPSFIYLDSLKRIYTERNFKPFFIKSYEEKGFVDSLIILLEKSYEHGLDPEFYHLNSIASEFYNSINDTINNPHRLTQLANSELFISNAVITYAYHLRYGVVNPKKIFPNSYTLPVVDLPKRDLLEPLRQGNIIRYLQDIQPKNEKYKRLQAALKKFYSYKDIEWKIIKTENKKLETGSTDLSLVQIAERLIRLGYLDTSKVKMKDFSIYTSLLLDPVKKFQRLNGLNDDGVIGKGTIEKLNQTPEEYITKIKINLERFRWNDYSNTSKYLLVNIPDFKLYAMENRKEIFNMKVCTGLKRPSNYQKHLAIYKRTKKYYDKPDDWETPCLSAEISYMVLNPTWNVPASIIREEILREMTKDSNYLHIKNFKAYRDGIEINLNEVNIEEFSSEKIPYTIVQDPGPGNALGKIKFMFKNPFGIYLHDTPSRTPFSYSNRAVSHGCVRVEKPLLLSQYILRGHSMWNIDYLKIEIGQEADDKSKIAEYRKKRDELRENRSFGKTTEIVLDKIIPLFIDYYTAWVDDNGEINFRDDVYGKDKILMKYLSYENKLQQMIGFLK